MKLVCSSCKAQIKNWDINIQENIAKCGRCGSVYKVTDLSDASNDNDILDSDKENESSDLNEIDQEILSLARKGSKLAAVKYCKESNNWGLKESKDYVDQLCIQHGIQSKGACFVATACYDDYESIEVIALRNYRDETLSKTILGRLLIRSYYKISPFFARLISSSNQSKKIIRKFVLGPWVNRLLR